MTTWTKQTLGNCVNLLSGFPFKSHYFSNEPDDICLVKGENIGQGEILWNISKKWPIIEWTKYEKFQLEPDDVIVAMDRPWVPSGLKWANVKKGDPKALLVQRCARLRSKKDILDQIFLKYLIGGPEFVNYIKPITTGVNVPHISGRQILDFKLNLPPIAVQRRISNILSSYDNQINNNERRIKILEEMAQRLYTEWFVNFRFPGHEKVKMVDSPLGKIPASWSINKIEEKFNVVLGGTPSRKRTSYWENGTIPWINSGKVNEIRILEESELITEEALRKSAAKIMPKRTTLIAITGATLGQVSLTEIECCANQSVVGVFDETEKFSEYIFLKIKDKIRHIIALQGGGAQPHINKDIVSSIKIVIPHEDIINVFSSKVKPIFDGISVLLFQNKNLKETRDLLIPQLVTGRRELKNDQRSQAAKK